MAKKMKKTMSMMLVLCMMVSMFSVTAFASNSSADEFISANGNDSSSATIVESESTFVDENGNTNVVIKIEQSETYVNENGAEVDRNEVENTTIVETPEGERVSASYTIDGTEKTEEINVPTGTVGIPTTEGESNKLVGDPVGTETITNGSVESGNYTTDTVVQQGSITVETTDIKVKENISAITTDMDHVSADVTPNETNDLIKEDGSHAPEEYLPGAESGSPIEDTDYDFVYVGTGNTSIFRPSVVFTDPMTPEDMLEKWGDGKYGAYIHSEYYAKNYISWLDEETQATIEKVDGKYATDDEGFVLDKNGNRVMKQEKTVVGPDGKTYYLHRVDAMGTGLNAEGWYQDGEWVRELNGSDKYGVVYGTAQQFVLVDSKSGEVVTVYCADMDTLAQEGYGYNVENLEDATYYEDEQAKKIRSIANAGYWGTESGFGSLEALKERLAASNQFTEEELASLTDGTALTATQMAIWSCSNKMAGINFVNAFSVGGSTTNGDVAVDKEDEVKLMFKIYEYLTNLEGTDVEKTSADTIINEDNFIKNMDLTVIKKDESHANNQDDDATNDAYVTDLTFALVVTPAKDNDDELVVKVITSDGTVLATGRIAGEAQNGETALVADANGNYKFSGITMIEGQQSFSITLEGVQNLKEGVYLYTSEVRDGTSSQTMVGVANGKRAVNVSMDIKFELNVDDEVIVSERVWHEEGVVPETLVNDPAAANAGVFALAAYTPLDDIPDEEVPLADAPQTGDEVIIFAVLTVLAGISLAAMHVSEKKRKEEV